MAQSAHLVDLVQRQIDQFLESHDPIVRELGPDATVFVDFSRSFLQAGKRFRAQFCYWGWHGVNSLIGGPESTRVSMDSRDHEGIIRLASALELFHSAALIHDDIIDESDTRRGAAAIHRRFADVHRHSGWDSDAAEFGISAAILLGDLLLAWSDELFESGLDLLDNRDWATLARAEFSQMRSEIVVGQYLDVLEEKAWPTRPLGELVARAITVATYKSAKYSVEAPLRIGAAFGGASTAQKNTLSEYGRPLGIAFQLRDDLLGVFGDPRLTGKPSGDDLVHGKRTVLIAFARQNLDAAARRDFDSLVGDPTLERRQIESLQETIRDSGAVALVEASIADHVVAAKEALTKAPIDRAARTRLSELAERLTNRVT